MLMIHFEISIFQSSFDLKFDYMTYGLLRLRAKDRTE
jgi:hypothetical protein